MSQEQGTETCDLSSEGLFLNEHLLREGLLFGVLCYARVMSTV